MRSWLLIEKLHLIFFWFPFQGTLHGHCRKTEGWVGRLVFIYLFFFVNRFLCFVQFLPLLNARLCFHVIHPHLIIQHKVSFSSHFISFFFLKINKFIHFYMWSSVFFLEIGVKCGQKCRKVAQKLLSEWLERTFKQRNCLAEIGQKVVPTLNSRINSRKSFWW